MRMLGTVHFHSHFQLSHQAEEGILLAFVSLQDFTDSQWVPEGQTQHIPGQWLKQKLGCGRSSVRSMKKTFLESDSGKPSGDLGTESSALPALYTVRVERC